MENKTNKNLSLNSKLPEGPKSVPGNNEEKNLQYGFISPDDYRTRLEKAVQKLRSNERTILEKQKTIDQLEKKLNRLKTESRMSETKLLITDDHLAISQPVMVGKQLKVVWQVTQLLCEFNPDLDYEDVKRLIYLTSKVFQDNYSFSKLRVKRVKGPDGTDRPVLDDKGQPVRISWKQELQQIINRLAKPIKESINVEFGKQTK